MNDCSLRIDGRELVISAGTSVLEAARGADLSIPTLCFLDRLSAVAACRLCLVEMEGIAPPPAA